MNIKKIGGTVLSVGVIVGGILLKGVLSKGNVNSVDKVTNKVEKTFGGISLSKLNEIAKSIDPRNYCTIDQCNFLVLHYKSNRGHKNFQTQLDLDDTLKLYNLNGGPVFEGQRWSHASEFVKRVNENVKFIYSQR